MFVIHMPDQNPLINFAVHVQHIANEKWYTNYISLTDNFKIKIHLLLLDVHLLLENMHFQSLFGLLISVNNQHKLDLIVLFFSPYFVVWVLVNIHYNVSVPAIIRWTTQVTNVCTLYKTGCVKIIFTFSFDFMTCFIIVLFMQNLFDCTYIISGSM